MRDDICLIIDSTRATAFELFQFEAISSALNGIVKVFLVSNERPESVCPFDDDIIFVSNEELFSNKDNNLKGSEKILPGNPDVKLLRALEDDRLASFQRFIRVEYDVVASHDLLMQFGKLVELATTHEFCSVSFFSHSNSVTPSKWPWWKTFHNRFDSSRAPPGPLYGGMLQICTFTREFERAYRRTLNEGWTAHYEVLMPSVAQWSGMTPYDLRKGGVLDYSVFGVRAPTIFPEKKKSFFHPIKNFTQFSRLPVQTIRNYVKHASNAPSSIRGYSQIRMTTEEISLFRSTINNCESYLEFGAGGSTAIACYSGVQKVYSVETDLEFLRSFVSNFELDDFMRFGRLQIYHVDIGQTGAWGAPVGSQDQKKWARYTNISWPVTAPNTVMIDGRFRVSVAARLYLEYNAKEHPNVLIHDYFGREHYTAVENFLVLEKKVGSLGLFKFRANKIDCASRIYGEFRDDPR